jgi:hypothetical protein
MRKPKATAGSDLFTSNKAPVIQTAITAETESYGIVWWNGGKFRPVLTLEIV